MKLRFNVFGFDVAYVSLDLNTAADTAAGAVEVTEKVLNKSIKGMSRFWVERMLRR
jgi:hypothetical protein